MSSDVDSYYMRKLKANRERLFKERYGSRKDISSEETDKLNNEADRQARKEFNKEVKE